MLGPLPEAFPLIRDHARRWFELQSCPKLKRIAFGARLFQPVPDRKTGYQTIRSYVSYVDLDIEGSSDFLYQINRPRPSQSGIAGLDINRLCVWSVARWQVALMQGPLQQMSLTESTEGYGVQLQLDINTDPHYGDVLPQDHLVAIFSELVDLGEEIAHRGDVK